MQPLGKCCGEKANWPRCHAQALWPHILWTGYGTAEIICSTTHVHHEVLTWSQAALYSMPVWASPESHGCCCTGATSEQPHGYVIWDYVMAMSWLLYGYIVTAAMAAVSARREIVLWLPWQSGENKRVCSSYSSLSLLPASQFVPCLPWVQQTVGTAQQLASRTGSVIQLAQSAGYPAGRRPWGSQKVSRIPAGKGA